MIAAASACTAVEASDAESPEAALRSATVTVAERCAGVVVEGARHVVTAAHCVGGDEADLPLTLADGTRRIAQVLVVDRARDMAILGLAEAAPVRGLAIADSLPEPGAPLLFAGRADFGDPLQHVTVVRLGRCPSLPQVQNALFTSLRGIKGDSGAPIVDEHLRVVGLVHGGAQCSIAAPTAAVPAMLDALVPSS
jgi:S1-C subfamily serine protease